MPGCSQCNCSLPVGPSRGVGRAAASAHVTVPADPRGSPARGRVQVRVCLPRAGSSGGPGPQAGPWAMGSSGGPAGSAAARPPSRLELPARGAPGLITARLGSVL